MLKNRKIIVLAILVMGIWGTICYRIYKQMSDPEIEPLKMSRRGIDTIQVQKYAFSFEYDDPFLKTTRKEVRAERKITPIKVEPTPEIVANWAAIRYLGVSYNNSRSRKTAMIKYNGNDIFVKEGEKIEGFSIIKIYPDSIWVGYDTKKKYLRKEN